MRGRDQILRVSRVRAAGMQGHVTGRRTDAAVLGLIPPPAFPHEMHD
jgi:hypothetical protein